jgi:hypothetical protein
MRRRTTAANTKEWAARTDRPRVLIEHPDGASRWAYERILQGAGYDVVSCSGPEQLGRERTRCALLDEGACALVQGADVVVSSERLRDRTRIVEAQRASYPHVALVVETVRERCDEEDCVLHPITEGTLRRAVRDRLAKAGVPV